MLEVFGPCGIELVDGDIDGGQTEHGYFFDGEACGPFAPASGQEIGEQRFTGMLQVKAVRFDEFGLFA
jgi:hypothetical protein